MSRKTIGRKKRVTEPEPEDTGQPTKTPRRRSVQARWDDKYIFLVYDLAKDGWGDDKIVKFMGIARMTFTNWTRNKDYKLFQMALELGRDAWATRHTSDSRPFADHLYRRLPEPMKVVWDEITEMDRAGDDPRKIAAVLNQKSKRCRQNLFLYAWVDMNFSISSACRKIGVSRMSFLNWCKDRKFRQLVNEIQECKKDFFESSLIQMVKEGDGNAILFANRTLNKDRGYSEKNTVDINVSGQVNHQHEIVGLEQLNLPLNIQKLILQEVRKVKSIDSEEVKSLPLPASMGIDFSERKKVGRPEAGNLRA